MHPLEFKNQKTGTGRLTHLGLNNSEVITGVDFTQNHRVNELITNKKCVLLYPGEDAENLSEKKEAGLDFDTVFLIDGTWPCAKKILRLSFNLQKLPKIAFHTKLKSKFYIKQQPHQDCLSTIEATSELIKVLGEDLDHDLFLRPFQEMIKKQVACALDPELGGYRRKPYKDVNIRITSKKRRKLFYETDS